MASEGGNNGDGRGSADHPAAAQPASATPASTPKLRRIEITNYKAIDHLVLEIPAPTMPDDPDIFVIGSKNGVGKTSLLECCAMAHMARKRDGLIFFGAEVQDLIRSDFPHFSIHTHYNDGRSSLVTGLPDGTENLSSTGTSSIALKAGDSAVEALFGRTADPLVVSDLLLFHSYRKVTEGSLRPQQMLNPRESHGSSALKLAILSMLMAKSGLIEGSSAPTATFQLERLNQLLSAFAGGRIDKLRTVAADRLDIRVATPKGTTFSFDALSSGQKEILSTLFLIWKETTSERPGLVLIDEPELHLNAEWQREFIHQLHTLAPQNQYILATHSEDIFASVPEDRRVLLGPQG